MSNPPITSGPSFVQHTVGVPTVHADATAATWLGNALAAQRTFPMLPQLAFSARANSRVSLTEAVPRNDPRFSRGSRMGRLAGTIDMWLTTGDAATDIAFLRSVESATPPFHTFGVNADNQFVGSLEDKDGSTVAAWTADTFAAVAEGRTLHVQVAWNSQTPIEGLYHVVVYVDGKQMPTTDFSTAPTSPWDGFTPNYLVTGTMADADFNGTMLLTQLAPQAVL